MLINYKCTSTNTSSTYIHVVFEIHGKGKKKKLLMQEKSIFFVKIFTFLTLFTLLIEIFELKNKNDQVCTWSFSLSSHNQ